MGSIDWDSREYPGHYQPVQLDPNEFNLPCGFCDWWNRRSISCCCCFPCFQCCGGRCNPCLVQKVDPLDPEIYKKTMQMPTKCPEEFKGVWWLEDNIAAESLVIFTDSFWEDQGDGIWYFEKDVPQSWLRDYSGFGICLGAGNAWSGCCSCCSSNWWNEWQTKVSITWNFPKGKGTLNDLEWVFKINENEWQKPSFKAKPGEPNANEITYMYRWRRVIGPDGNRTAAWDDMKTRIESPMPHQNCFTPWCPCWPLCISKKDRLLNMTYNSPTQVMILPPQFRTAAYSGCCIGPSCPCPCMCPCFANVYGVWTKNFPGPEATKIGKNSE